MKTRELFRELLFRSNLNASGLAEKLKDQGTQQAQLSRFSSGITKEPKRSTLLPVADYYGISVEAFFNEELAAQILKQIETGEFVVKRHRANPVAGESAQFPLRNLKQLAEAVDLIAERINEIDDPEVCELVASRLQTLARAPDSMKARNSVLEAIALDNRV